MCKKAAGFICNKMELIVISSPDILADESAFINNLFIAGLKCFHIRKPNSNIHAHRQLIEGIMPQFYNRISLHQFHETAADYGIKRLHYTERDREAASDKNIAELKTQGYILSTSVHDKALLPLLSAFDYAFYGPVFNSISKPEYQSTFPVNFKLDRTNIRLKVIALGGIDISNLQKVKTMDFDGVAVLGTLWNQPDKAIECFNQLKENLPV